MVGIKSEIERIMKQFTGTRLMMSFCIFLASSTLYAQSPSVFGKMKAKHPDEIGVFLT